ncbi:MAG: hypothetical protein ABEI86_11780 [Halobacteriaceae archaeon]
MTDSNEMQIRSLDVEIEDRRIDEIFRARTRASQVLTETSMRRPKKEMIRASYGAIRSYIHVVEDLIDKESEVGQYIWYYVPLGTVEFIEPKSGKGDERVFRGLQSILHSPPVMQRQFTVRSSGYMKGHTSERTVEEVIPVDVLWNVYSVINQYLAEIGFDLEVDPEDGFLDLRQVVRTSTSERPGPNRTHRRRTQPPGDRENDAKCGVSVRIRPNRRRSD